jgi:hypothetical protein
LQYADWRNFEYAIFKAMEACKTSGYAPEDLPTPKKSIAQIEREQQKAVSGASDDRKD